VEFEIGIGKTARRAYGFDEVAIVPSRRTRDPEDVSIKWEIDAYTFELPMMASAMDAAVSPDTAIEIGRVGGLACLNLEGLWTRYEDPESIYDEIGGLPDEKATRRMQELYAEPVKDELIGRRIEEIKRGGVVSCASLTPQRVEKYAPAILEAGLDILVIQGTVVSAEHVSSRTEPLNLKQFIARFDLPVIVGGELPDRAAPDADRRHRRPGRCGARQRVHDARGARGGGSAGNGDRRRGCRPS
jgi:IMP dehydrogenase